MNEKNRAAIYCRLSKDDEQVGDSVSIETQKMLLTGYCVNQGFEIVDMYIDDGYSGLNFNRPSFKRLISDLENGKFDIVITKDLSRLGRDYIQTGYYIDVYFSTKHIRYIAVNDGIDTLSENNDIAPFKNILNDMYAKDLSRKVKSAKHQRAKSGLYISGQPPYGYKVDPHDRNRLAVDPEPAQVVKHIFELAAAGNNYSEISRILEREQIITPSAYKVMNGDTRFLKFASKEHLYKWSYQTVRTIVCNRVYVGDMVNHKTEIVNYKTKQQVRISPENQIIVPNTHEAIIDRDMFNAINSPFAKRRKPNHNYENIFKGFIFCAECGGEMQLIAGKVSKKKTKPMFRCARHAADKCACTRNHFVYYDDLLSEIKNQLSVHIAGFIDSSAYGELCKNVIKEINIRAQEIRKNQLQKELQNLNKRIRNRYKAPSTDIDKSELDVLCNTQKQLLQKMTTPSADFDGTSNIEIYNLTETLKEHLRQIPVDKNTLKLLIEKIEIGHLERNVCNGTTQRIKIHYRFNNFFLN